VDFVDAAPSFVVVIGAAIAVALVETCLAMARHKSETVVTCP